MHRAVHPHDGPGPIDRSRQSDLFAGYMEKHIIGILSLPLGLLSIIMRGGVEHNTTIYNNYHNEIIDEVITEKGKFTDNLKSDDIVTNISLLGKHVLLLNVSIDLN